MTTFITGAALLSTFAGVFMSWFLAWIIVGLFRVDENPVDKSGRNPRLIISALIGPIGYLLLDFFIAITTDLSVQFVFLGATSLVAAVLIVVLPIWGIKNLIFGPRRVWGAFWLFVFFFLSYPLISTALAMKDFLPTFWSALQGEASLLELVMSLWRTALSLP
jgi:hypothetical protein